MVTVAFSSSKVNSSGERFSSHLVNCSFIPAVIEILPIPPGPSIGSWSAVPGLNSKELESILRNERKAEGPLSPVLMPPYVL
jgi:hypothetical protein